jgi:hypothetical protein
MTHVDVMRLRVSCRTRTKIDATAPARQQRRDLS